MSDVDTEQLVEEIARYLAVVDLFRALGCDPTWRSEAAHTPTTSGDEPQQSRIS